MNGNDQTTNTETATETSNAETTQVAETNTETIDKAVEQTQTTEPNKEETMPELTLDSYGDLGLVETEDIKVDKEYVGSFKELALKHKLSPEIAKEFASLQYNEAKKAIDALKQIKNSWSEENSKTYGDNLKNVETNCGRVLAQFDKEGKFAELLTLAGADKAPATLAFLKSIGDIVLEKSSVNSVSTPNKEKSLEDFYRK